MTQGTLLTPELDNALDWYGKTSQFGWNFLYHAGNMFSFQNWDPLKYLERNASLALVEAAAKNDVAHIEQLLNVSFVNNYAKYLALVAATQSGNTAAINMFLNLPDLAAIIQVEVWNANRLGPVKNSFKDVDFKDSLEDASLAERLDLHDIPNLMIEAATRDRVDVVKRLLDFEFIKKALNGSWGYYACLRAAEFGCLSTMNELLKYQVIQDLMVNNGDAIRLAAENGHLNTVNRLLELPRIMSCVSAPAILRYALHTGTPEVVARLLEVPAIDAFLRDPAQHRDIEECVDYACYTNKQKPHDATAARMLQMLLQYPIVAHFAEKHKNDDRGEWKRILQKLETMTAPASSHEIVVSEPATARMKMSQ